jgi:hypothetical protein
MLMFNSRNLGALIVAEEPTVKSWEDGQYNIQNMSIEESHFIDGLQEGQVTTGAKNVKIRPNEFDCPKSDGAFLFSPGLSLFPAYLPASHSVAGMVPKKWVLLRYGTVFLHFLGWQKAPGIPWIRQGYADNSQICSDVRKTGACSLFSAENLVFRTLLRYLLPKLTGFLFHSPGTRFPHPEAHLWPRSSSSEPYSGQFRVAPSIHPGERSGTSAVWPFYGQVIPGGV